MRDLSQLKICFLAGTLEHGGAERQLFYIVRALREAGASLRLLSLDRGEFWEEKIKTLGVSITWVGEQPSRLKRLFRVLKEARKDPPDVLQSQHFFANAYVGMTARLLRMTGIGAMRNDGRSEVAESGPMGGRLNLRLPKIMAANSQVAIQYAAARGVPPSRLYFLPNVVDTERFRPADRVADGPFVLMAVGRVAKQKRLDRFISLLGRLRHDFNLDVKGWIVGPAREDEDLKGQLETQARNLGLLPDHLQFKGGIGDMSSVYREAAVCVLTSDFEGTPNVLLEAMASGLPVVATRVGGVPGIVRHGQTGFLFDPDDLDGLAIALAELARNPRLRTEMGRSARTFVEENHSLNRLPIYLGGLYELALPPRRPLRARVVQAAPISTTAQS